MKILEAEESREEGRDASRIQEEEGSLRWEERGCLRWTLQLELREETLEAVLVVGVELLGEGRSK